MCSLLAEIDLENQYTSSQAALSNIVLSFLYYKIKEASSTKVNVGNVF